MTSSYSIIDTFEVVNDKGKYRLAKATDDAASITDRVVKLRNPWGESDYKADWYQRFMQEFQERKVE